MAIKLEITVRDDCPIEDIKKEFEAQMAALGFERSPLGAIRVQATEIRFVDDAPSKLDTDEQAPTRILTDEEADAQQNRWIKEAEPKTPLGPRDGDRVRGHAKPGGKRRTNAQIEEDDRYFAQKARAEAAMAEMERGVKNQAFLEGRRAQDGPDWKSSAPTGDHGREFTFTAYSESAPISAAAMASISTGAPRVNPEDAAKDAADEAAETAAHASVAPTLEDLRAEIAKYIEKFGVKASVNNMRNILGCSPDKVPAAEIENAIAKVRAAIDGATVMTPNSPIGNTPTVSVMPPPVEVAPTTATREELFEAIKAYARKYDGTDDVEDMPNTKQDLPQVFTRMFGKGVTGFGSMPDKTPEAFGRVLLAIREATDTNAFKREKVFT